MAGSRIETTNIKELSTVHQNFVEPVENLFNFWNGDNPDVVGGYNETTALIQQFLGDAISKNKTVRVLGGNWSWTKVGFTNDWMVNTSRLNRMKRMLPAEVEAAQYNFTPDSLLFAQCGCSVQEVSRVLQTLGRSLPTSGASNGQSIVGVFSNCTHGSAIDYGSTPEFVAGLHIITGPNSHVYLERASRPIVSSLFVQKIGATLIRDDGLFNAALVSFGSFGFIHGVMIETEPLYLLNAYRRRISFELVKPLLETLDFSNTPFLPKPNCRPFYFQITLNPYDLLPGPYVNVMYKEPHRVDYPRTIPDLEKAGPGDDAPTMLGMLTSVLPVLTPMAVNQILKSSYTELADVWGTHGEIFSSALARGRVLSTAIAVPVQHTNRLLDIALAINRDKTFVGVFACRFVKGTAATLGFTQYPQTCVLEFDSFEAPSTWTFYHRLWAEVEAAGIPYSFHWGKLNNLNPQRLRSMYGTKVDEWIAARNRLLSKEMLAVFTN